MSRVYGLHPWDVDRLTVSQWLTYRDDLERIAPKQQTTAGMNPEQRLRAKHGGGPGGSR